MPYGNNKNTKAQKGWNVRETVKRIEEDPQGRVDLIPGDFDRLIKQKGAELRVFRTGYCPNVKSVDGAEHEIDCALCNGSGYIDLYPICTKGFMQTQELEKMYESKDGYHDGNTVSITFLIGIELQYFTRIEVVDYTELYYQRVLRKPATNIDILKYKACRINFIVDKNNVEYFQDTDFVLDPNGSVQWIQAVRAPLAAPSYRKPADNVIYSIHYETHPTFRAVKAMHVTRFTQYRTTDKTEKNIEQIKLPEQWMCVKEFLLRRKDINTAQDLNEGPFDNHTNNTGNNDGIDD